MMAPGLMELMARQRQEDLLREAARAPRHPPPHAARCWAVSWPP